MEDIREINEYNYIRSKFIVPMNEWHKVYDTFHLMAEKGIYLNNAVLDLFYAYTRDFNYYLTAINLVYNTYDHKLNFGFDDLSVVYSPLAGLSRNHDKNIKYYNDLDDIMNFISNTNLEKIKEDYNRASTI